MPNYETAFYDSGVHYDTPGTGNQPKKGTHMAGNRVPTVENDLLALGEDMADGCHNHEVDVGLQHIKEVDIRASITALRNSEAGFNTARGNRQTAMDSLHAIDATVTAFLAAARSVLIRFLGNRWSTAWVPTGFPDLSTAVPATQEKRLNLCASLKTYFTTVPAQAVAAMDVTAVNAETQFQALSTGRDVLATKDELQTTAKQARDAAYDNLRKREHDLINELATLLADNDARWHAFGLSMPADPNTPMPVPALTLTPGTAGKIVVTWPRAVRATRYRPFVQIVGVDEDFVAREAVHDLTVNLAGFTTGQTVKVYIVAANDAGEAQPSPTQQIIVP
ncbi:MAG: fibronectin type III domain-containing protein [Verrucomicrobiota bacterium]